MSTAELRGPTRHRTPTPPGCCPWCKKPSPEGRATWHPACVKEFRSEWPAERRRAVEERDGGVCATCGHVATSSTETAAVIARIRRCAVGVAAWRRILGHPGIPSLFSLGMGATYHGLLAIDDTPVMGLAVMDAEDRGRWHMDHVVALADGGTNELDNLQTLCVSCHKAKSAAEAATRARRRRS